MADSCAVLIAPAEVVSALLARRAFSGEVLAFGEDEIVDAFGAIVSRWPDVIALDGAFARSPRGLALVDRVRSDPLLAAADLLVIEHDGSFSRVGSTEAGGFEGAGDAPGGAAPGTSEAAPEVRLPTPDLDSHGTRRVARIPIRPNVEVLIDGKEAVLVDLSVLGAQVLSPTVVRPNKPVRMVMPDEDALLKVLGVIVWSRFEMLHGQPLPQYRAGISFTKADPAAVVRYCKRRGRAAE